MPRAATFLALAVLLVAAAPARADSILSPRVTLDHYSVIVTGKRVVVNAGELHPFRLPAQAAWPAMLDKMRAASHDRLSQVAEVVKLTRRSTD